MQPKISIQNGLVGILSGIGTFVVIGEIFQKLEPYFSWGSDLCKICDIYRCTRYNDICNNCADDVLEEFNSEVREEDEEINN